MKIGFIGVGGMACHYRGLLKAKTFAPSDIIVHSHRLESCPYAEAHGLQTAASNADVAAASDLVVLADAQRGQRRSRKLKHNWLTGKRR